MGTQSQKKNSESVTDAVNKGKNPAAAAPAGLALDPLAQMADGLAVQRAMTDPRKLSPKSAPGLQRALGNQYVQTMMTRAAQGQATSTIATDVQTDVARKQESLISKQDAGDNGGGALSNTMSGEIDRQVSRGGKTLPGDTHAKLRQNLGVEDPENIQVHADKEASQLSKSLGARAFTTGRHIFFREGAYDPGSLKGQRLIYHESAHTVQQGATAQRDPQGKPQSTAQPTAQRQAVVTSPDDAYEQEADEVAEKAVAAPAPQLAGDDAPPEEGTGAANAAFEQATQASTSMSTQIIEDTENNRVQMDEDEEEKKKKEAEKKKEEKKGEADKEKDKQKKGAEEQGKDKGEEKDKKRKEEKEVKKVPKPEKPKEPEKVEKKLPLPEATVDVDEAKFDPDEDYEEPEMDEEMLPTWGELASGTVQMSADTVAEEIAFRETLMAGTESEEGFTALSGDIEVEGGGEGEGAEDVDKGAIIGDALGEGALAGLQEGATEFISDQIVQAATSKIPYADGFINMAKIAQDPNQWFEDNVMAIGDGAKGMVKGFEAIGDEDTAWGYMAATLEAIIGVIDFINSIVGLINTIFQIILAISKALVILGNLMISLCPGPFGIFAWTPAVFVPVVTFFTNVIAFLDPINNAVGAVGNILSAVKYSLQPLVILFRILDIAESKADPEKLKEKQEKLQSATKGFVKSTTQKVANKAKDKAAAKIQKRMDQRSMRKAEQEADAAGIPQGDQMGPLTESQQKAKDKLDAAREKYEASKKADENEKWSGLLPHKAIKKQWSDVKENVTKVTGGDPKDYSQRPEKYKDLSPEEYEKQRMKGSREEAKERTAGLKELKDRKEKTKEAEALAKAKKGETENAEQAYAEEKAYHDKKQQEMNDIHARMEAVENEQEKARAEYKAAVDADDPVQREKATKRLNELEMERTSIQYFEQPEAERLAYDAQRYLDRKKQLRDDAIVAEHEAQQQAERKREKQMQHLKDVTRGEWKKTWEDVGGGSLLDAGAMGGQRHGLGITGASGALFDLIEEQTGVDLRWPLKAMFGMDDGDPFAAALAKANDLYTDYMQYKDSADEEEAARATQCRNKLPNYLGKIGPDAQKAQIKKAQDMEKRADNLGNHNEQLQKRLRKEAGKIRGRVNSAQTIRDLAAREGITPKSEMAQWAEKYGAKVFTLQLDTKDLPPEGTDYKRVEPDDPVYVIKGVGQKRVYNYSPYPMAGVQPDLYEDYDKEIADPVAEVVLYRNKSYQIEPKPVKMEPTSGGETTYEPVRKRITHPSGDVTRVTVEYEEAVANVQTKRDARSPVQRTPAKDDEALDAAPAMASISLAASRPSPAPASSAPVIQRAPAEEEEKKESDFLDTGFELEEDIWGDEAWGEEEPKESFEKEEPFDFDETTAPEGEAIGERMEMLNWKYQADLAEQLPPPPENVFEEIEGAAHAYREVDAHEYELRLHQQDIAGLKMHSQAQLSQVNDARALTAANQMGVAAHQKDADTKLAAQSQMKQASSAQEQGAQQTAEKSGGGAGILGDIFGQIMQGLGLGGGKGGDTNAMKSGTEKQAETSDSASKATQDAGKIADKRTAETKQVKAEAAGVQNMLGGFDSQMDEQQQGNREGLQELDQAADENTTGLETAQEEKARLREGQAEAFGSADEWAMEHRMIRDELFDQLEADLATAEEGEPMEEAAW
jgi:hypothetical protein